MKTVYYMLGSYIQQRTDSLGNVYISMEENSSDEDFFENYTGSEKDYHLDLRERLIGSRDCSEYDVELSTVIE